MQIFFYSGVDCHLCDLAKDLLKQQSQYNDLNIEFIDVRQDHQTYHLYGARIPVLKRQDNQAELGWPFDSDALTDFLS
ncbi:glutaredoxin family protein [Aliiglaciecola litoralis]|uniref:Glutaredoxin family protein n=1 Tax=Aliiglaciecola litoralis TaxID=582857 RepID=A0ABP3WLN3_9ALTE